MMQERQGEAVPRDVEPDTPAVTTVHDHEFEPEGEWWSLCRHCRLGSASHSRIPPEHGPPWRRPPSGRETDEWDDYGPGPEPELPHGAMNEDNMLDAEMHRRGTTDDRRGKP